MYLNFRCFRPVGTQSFTWIYPDPLHIILIEAADGKAPVADMYLACVKGRNLVGSYKKGAVDADKAVVVEFFLQRTDAFPNEEALAVDHVKLCIFPPALDI